jgi:uncharacterized repeat protein (TIGR01451 family)
MRTFHSGAVLALLLSAVSLASTPAWALTSDMAILKTGPATVSAGNNISYTIQVTNHGPDPALNAGMSDAVPAGTTFVSFTSDPSYSCGALPAVGGTGNIVCSNGSMAVNATATFTLVVHVPASTLSGTSVGNVASTGSANTEGAPGNEVSVVFTTVAATPNLSVAKAGPAVVTAGLGATYTIDIANSGPSDAHGVTLFDPLPAGTTFTSRTQNTGPAFACTDPTVGTTGPITCTLATLAAGASAHFTIQVGIDPNAPNGFVISNTTLAFTTDTDTDNTNNSSTTTATVSAAANLRAQKTAPATATAGQNLTFNLGIDNLGPSNSQNATLVDFIPPGTTYQGIAQTGGPPFGCTVPAVGGTGTVSCSITTLNAGASATFDLVVAVDAATPPGSVIGNGANANSPSTPDPDNSNDTAFTATTVTTSANIGVSKSGPPTVVAGTDITYSIAAGNGGPSDATSFTLSDVIPPGTTFVSGAQTLGPAFSCSFPAVGGGGTMICSTPSLPMGQFGVFSLVVHVPSGYGGGPVNNTATLLSATPDPVLADNTSSVVTTVSASADVQVSKTGPASVTAGTNITYNVGVTNTGPSDAQAVSLSDALPPNTTFVSYTQNTGPAFSLTTPAAGGTGTVTSTVAALPSGSSATFTLVLAVAAAAPNGASLANTVTASSTTADPAPGNNSATSTATVVSSADVQVSKTGPASVTAGTNIAYNLGVTNAGPSDAQSLSLSDPLPANTTFVSYTQNTGPAFSLTTPAVGGTGTVTSTIANLPSGASATFTLVLAVAASAPNAASLANTVTASSTTTDPAPGNNSATSTATVATSADMQVTKSGPATIDAGSNITYTITATNAGTSDAQAVSLSDTLPANTTFVSLVQGSGPSFTLTTPAVGAPGTVTATLATLPAAASATFTLVLKVASATASGSSIANTATVSSTTTDPTPGNNSATSTATVTTSADLVVTKTGPPSLPTSSTITYNLSLSNNGPSDALTVSLADTLPAGTTFVSLTQLTGPTFSCTTPAVGSPGTVTCTLASLPATSGAMFTLVVQALPTLLGGSVVTNTATATTATTDPTPADNTASAVTNITAITSFSGPSATGSGTVTATFVGGGPACAFATARLIPVSGDPASPKAMLSGVSFPHGLFTFTTSNCVPGSTLNFVITYPADVERAQYWKYGPTPGAPTPHWYILPATFSGQVATFSITDGQMGDDDLIANGAIVDQGGPGFGSPPVPTLSEWMQLLLAALLLAAGMVALRRRMRG